ncbi:alpha/beta fold hydrolase [Corynebacterium atrinae]|uniref:alpha/beta fold hydrolase n=1 Tax=Corynebacterium atrinae TaxID=1336740 RepID=UPI0025B38BFB|nr:alpha/beta fold hydrolase [Corynebacterium atrinae]
MTELRTTHRAFNGLDVREHTLTVEWDRAHPGEQLEVFCRELSADDTLPPLLYLQGGPGYGSPRPLEVSGWIGEALKHYRVFLLDQRGTGRSTRLDRFSNQELIDAEHLALLRADHIVADAEDLRLALGFSQWDILGQSFGGFCITTYVSLYPDSVRRAMFTGGLPGMEVHADDVYRATYGKLAKRHEAFYQAIPFAEERIREICHHLDNSAELLPTGERLSSRRFRTIGIELGRGTGFDNLGYLLEAPFHIVRGEKRLRGDTLADLSARLSFEAAPLYAVIHESIYGGNVPGPTAWSAHRMREEVEGFEENLDPRAAGRFYLTGEHIYPWLFEEDPALHAFRRPADTLAMREWSRLYAPEIIGSSEVVAAAAIYEDDIFVPLELSLATARRFPDLQPWVMDTHQHDGLRADGEHIFTTLLAKTPV